MMIQLIFSEFTGVPLPFSVKLRFHAIETWLIYRKPNLLRSPYHRPKNCQMPNTVLTQASSPTHFIKLNYCILQQ